MSLKLNGRLALALLALLAALPAAAQTTAPTYSVTDRFKGPDGGYDYVHFDPAMKRAYVGRTDGVLALDVATGTVNGHLALATHAHAVLPVNNGAQLLVTDAGPNVAHLVDAVSGKLIVDIPVGQKPDGALFDPASGLALVMNGHSGDVTLIDPVARKAVGTIAVGGSVESPVSDGAGKVFITIEDQNRIAVLDMKTRARAGYYALPGCDGPTGMVYASEGGVLIAGCANKVAKVIRAADGADLATLAIGAGPDQLSYDPKRHLVFIPCGKDGVLDVVAVRGPTDIAIVQTVKTQVGARTSAVDPQTGKVYLPTARYVPVAGAVKPVAKPGTFEVLVVSPGA